MKHIEQKLKSDARAFKHEPDKLLHDNIMQSIMAEQKTSVAQKSTSFKWLIPTSFAFIALLIFMFNMSNNPITPQPLQNIANNSTEFNIDMFAFNIESELTNNIKIEQQAIVNDLNHIKSLLIL